MHFTVDASLFCPTLSVELSFSIEVLTFFYMFLSRYLVPDEHSHQLVASYTHLEILLPCITSPLLFSMSEFVMTV